MSPELVASLSGRLPQEVEEGLCQQVATYEANFKSVMCKFPTTAIDQVVFDYLRVGWVGWEQEKGEGTP